MLDKIDTSSWMEFKITEVFNVHYGNKFDKNKMTFTNPTINFVSRTGNNNRVSCVVDNNGCAPFPEGFLTLALGGSIGSCFVQQKPFYTGQNVAVLEPIHKISNETALFLSECIMKKCKIMYKAFSDEINKHLKTDLTIKLPVLSATDENYSAGDIDYELMESIIRELEEERIRELEVYLQVTGLNDTTLTPEEEQALRLGPGGVKSKRFRIGDLFDCETWSYGNNNNSEFYQNSYSKDLIRVVSGTTTNNGISNYINPSFTNCLFKDCLTISTRGEYSGTVKYHDYTFTLANNVLSLPMPHLSYLSKLYIGVCLNKLNYSGYTNYPTRDKLMNNVIQLPINTKNQPDWDYIEIYMSAIQKKIIQNYNKDTLLKIKTTKQVVGD